MYFDALYKNVMDHCRPFSCGDKDLDEFFIKDVFLYEEEMLGKTYCWITNSRPHDVVCLMTFYEHNGFLYMHKTEEVERIASKRFNEEGRLVFGIPETEPLHTRMMYFDLKRLG